MSASEIDFIRVQATLLAASEAAALQTLPLFRTPLGVDNKLEGGFDPVTEADRGAETAIRAVIGEDLRGERPHYHRSEINDAHAFERSARHEPPY